MKKTTAVSAKKLRQMLKRAVKANDVGAVKGLVAEFATIGEEVRDDILEIAAWRGFLECAKHLLPATKNPNPALSVAADGVRPELVRFLLPHCNPRMTFSRFDSTALHRAAYRGCVESVEILLMASDPHQKCARGWTAQDWAVHATCKGKSKAKIARVVAILESYPLRIAEAEAAVIEASMVVVNSASAKSTASRRL